MNQANKGLEQGSQKVVYDHILARIPGGVHVKNDADFKDRLEGDDTYLPAGTAIKKSGDDYVVIKKTNGGDEGAVDTDYSDCVGLTEYDIKADDFPLVSIVTDAVVRVDALPEDENEGFALLKAAIPGLKPY